MKTLIRIVFVIFITNGIDYLGSDNCCDNCCDCFKGGIKEYEEIKEDEDNTAESLVNDSWYYTKKNNLVLKIFKKKDDDVFPSKDNGDKISIKSDEKGNPKIAYQNLEGEKYAFFEIKTRWKNTVYLYCSDVESSEEDYGIFEHMDHISISVIACDTTNVKNIRCMFCECNNLGNLDLKNFNTKNVTNMVGMFSGCINLKKLEFGVNFNTENVTNMGYMFYECISLENLNLNNFNTEKVTNMMCMFCLCSKLKNLDISNFNTEKVTDMRSIFYGCSSLENLEFSENFNTINVTNMTYMFSGCSSFPENIKNKNVEEIINFFKEKNK